MSRKEEDLFKKSSRFSLGKNIQYSDNLEPDKDEKKNNFKESDTRSSSVKTKQKQRIDLKRKHSPTSSSSSDSSEESNSSSDSDIKTKKQHLHPQHKRFEKAQSSFKETSPNINPLTKKPYSPKYY